MIGFITFLRTRFVNRLIATNVRVIGIVTAAKEVGAVRFGKNT